MRIFAKKTFIFTLGEEEYPVQYQNFADVPAELTKDEFFKAAVDDGSVMILNNDNKKEIENNGVNAGKKGKDRNKSKKGNEEHSEDKEAEDN